LGYVYFAIKLLYEDTDWVKKSMKYAVEGSRPRSRPKRTWKDMC